MRTVSVVLSLTLLAACGGDKSPAAGDAGKATPASPDPKAGAGEAKSPADAKADGDAADAADDTAAGDDAKAVPDAKSTDAAAADGEAADDTAGAVQDAADAGASAAAGEAGGEAGGSDGGDAKADAPDPKALLTEAKSKKTKDERALAALAEAEAAGAEPKDLAKAANARGQALHATPDRAKTFFEWAVEKDPKSADAAFNLAKQAVVLGEVDETKKWLEETKKRGGKKLLAQVEYDPMWEIVADDPDVKALLQKK